ncbi:MAG TPA: PAS domain-containing sensor histidine kinase, partial [bacterium]|nr:PAS domain-containing sensor histidine kinase [bacterium]
VEELAPISIETWNTHTHPDDLAKSTKLLQIHFSKKTNHYEAECRMRHKNGAWVWIYDRGKVVEWDQDGTPLRMSGTHADITRRKEVEHELELAKIAAEEASLAKSEFLSSMSHELRTPLNAILGFAQILELTPNEPLSAKQKDATDQILKGGEHLLNLINDVLNLARIETGKLDLKIEPVDLQNVLDECLSVASALTQNMNITITTDNFTGAIVLADRVRLKQVLFNLLSNAVKYNRKNGHVNISSKATKDSWHQISISDTGRGIPTDKRDELFEPFARLGAENSIIEGTGIGLTITKRLLDAMGGRIDFISEEGVGTTFCVELPLASHRANKAKSSSF